MITEFHSTQGSVPRGAAGLKHLVRLAICFAILGLLPMPAQVQVIPQVADGAGWSTTIVLTNKTATAQSVTLKFYKDTVNGATQPWSPPFQESISITGMSLAAGSTLFLHTPGTAATLSQGWGELDAGAGVVGYAIFTNRVSGHQDQDATAPAVSTTSRILVPFDNSSGFITALAVVNPNAASETIAVNIRTTDGATSTGTLPNIPALGQMAFVMPQQLPGTTGKAGLAEFYSNSGTFSLIALRANPTGAFTAAPVYFETGPSVIAPTGAAGTLAYPGRMNSVAVATATQVIPQVADGAGWGTTIVLTNRTATAQLATLTFYMDTVNGATQPWNPPFQENVSLTSLNLPAGSAVFLHTTGTATALSQGWGQLDAAQGVAAYAIFTNRVPGHQDQDATAPAVSTTSRILVPFDNSSGFITALAVVDPNAAAETIAVNIRTTDGATSTGTLPNIPALGQMAFVMPQQLPGTTGKAGLAEFYSNSGTFSIIALRANPTGAFTAAPVYFETGAPIISTGSTGGNIVSGAFAINKITSSSILFPSTTEIESMAGGFSRYTQAAWDIVQGQLHIGACIVIDLTYASTGTPPNAAGAMLDAGASILANGPNLASGSALAAVASPIGPSYSLTPPTGTLASGTYTLTGNGGTEIGPFSVSGMFPASFVVTGWDAYTQIDRSVPLPLSWTGSGFSKVTILLSTTTMTDTTTHAVFVTCSVPASPASFTVPTEVLSHLLPVPPGSLTAFGLFEVLGTSETDFTASLVKTGGNIDAGELVLGRGYVRSFLPFNYRSEGHTLVLSRSRRPTRRPE